MLLKVGSMWEIIDDYKESLYVESKAKGYRAIRNIIKKYENKIIEMNKQNQEIVSYNHLHYKEL